ncbi:hypothetical protein ACFFLZ_05280 [Photobacterium aphoticum]|uniref:DUF4198 domain-containing protein n=2 Tax=Photobacterium aphoticum TaxID=754436 RepID=A0A0J1GPZ0_9GAMM|nr:hypothetical protein [Photobacterium aphoticum]KLV01818.1 hypothetical protein ABT58_05185 [Photobacterium aphoticum]PSU58693.1 hypothetical protein C9I90_05575 [Photobacterium aphoticum]GHA32708.1 hypothetical protein GCM10007086_02380 [Photobacterium aphoticum]
MKTKKSLTALFIASALSFGLAQPTMAHEYTLSVEDAERYGISVPKIKVNYDVLPYQHILFGFQLHVELEGATLNTTNVNALRDATTISTHNVVRPYRASANTISYRISGEFDHRAVNFIDYTLDKSVLSTDHDLTIRIPVEIDITPPDTPHADANKVASLNVNSVNTEDFLMESERTLYRITLNEGEFLPGCADPIAHSIIRTSNIEGMVRIWKKTDKMVEFVVEGGFHTPIVGNWNFELEPNTTTLNKTLHLSTPVQH